MYNLSIFTRDAEVVVPFFFLDLDDDENQSRRASWFCQFVNMFISRRAHVSFHARFTLKTRLLNKNHAVTHSQSYFIIQNDKPPLMESLPGTGHSKLLF